ADTESLVGHLDAGEGIRPRQDDVMALDVEEGGREVVGEGADLTGGKEHRLDARGAAGGAQGAGGRGPRPPRGAPGPRPARDVTLAGPDPAAGTAAVQNQTRKVGAGLARQVGRESIQRGDHGGRGTRDGYGHGRTLAGNIRRVNSPGRPKSTKITRLLRPRSG